MLNDTSSLDLPVQRQRRTLAQLDMLIARAEKDLARHAAAGRRLAAAGKDMARARLRLRLAEAQLAMLRRSRDYLLTGELPEAEARHQPCLHSLGRSSRAAAAGRAGSVGDAAG